MVEEECQPSKRRRLRFKQHVASQGVILTSKQPERAVHSITWLDPQCIMTVRGFADECSAATLMLTTKWIQQSLQESFPAWFDICRTSGVVHRVCTRSHKTVDSLRAQLGKSWGTFLVQWRQARKWRSFTQVWDWLGVHSLRNSPDLPQNSRRWCCHNGCGASVNHTASVDAFLCEKGRHCESSNWSIMSRRLTRTNRRQGETWKHACSARKPQPLLFYLSKATLGTADVTMVGHSFGW